jgi:hypothetical protein
MAETIARILVGTLLAYAAAGLGFAVAFASTRGGTLGFRIAIVPGAAALWPFLLRRWRSAGAAR